MTTRGRHHSAILFSLFQAIACVYLGSVPNAGASGPVDNKALAQCKAAAKLTEPAQQIIPIQSHQTPRGPGSELQFDERSLGGSRVVEGNAAPNQLLNVSYFDGKLAIEAHGARMADVLMAFQGALAVQVSGPTDSEEVVFADRCGTADEVLRDLMEGSDLQYILIQSPTAAGLIREIFLSRKVDPPSPSVMISRENLVDSTARLKKVDGAAERQLRSLADPNLGLAPPSGISASSSATAGGAMPVDPTQVLSLAPNPAMPEAVPSSPEKQVMPAGAYMQELYRLRQQLPQNSGPVPQ